MFRILWKGILVVALLQSSCLLSSAQNVCDGVTRLETNGQVRIATLQQAEGSAISPPACAFGRSAFVRYTVLGTGNTLRATTCYADTNVNSQLLVSLGTCSASPCQITREGSFDCSTEQGSEFSWQSVEGVLYYINIGGGLAQGTVAVSITDIPPTPEPTFNECLKSMESADRNGDNFLNQNEYTRFINYLTRDEYPGQPLSLFPTDLRQNFFQLTGDNGLIDIFGAKSGQTPVAVQQANLIKICQQTSVRIKDAGITEVPSQPPSQVPSISPSLSTSISPSEAGFTGNLTINSSFIFSNDVGLTAADFFSDISAIELAQAYADVVQKVSQELSLEGTIAPTVTVADGGLVSIDRIEDVDICPPNAAMNSLCLIAYASFKLSVAFADAEVVTDRFTQEMNAALEGGDLQDALPADSPLVFLRNAAGPFVGDIMIRSIFAISNTIGLTPSDPAFGARRDQLEEEYETMAQNVSLTLLREFSSTVRLVRSSPSIDRIVNSSRCPNNAPADSICHVAYGSFNVSVDYNAEERVRSEYTQAMNSALLQHKLPRDSPFKILRIVAGAFSGMLTIPSSFVISNALGLNASAEQIFIATEELEEAYAEVAENVTRTLASEGIFPSMRFEDDSAVIQRIIPLDDCPDTTEQEDSLCQIILASFNVSLSFEDADLVLAVLDIAMDLAIKDDTDDGVEHVVLQQSLPPDSPIVVLQLLPETVPPSMSPSASLAPSTTPTLSPSPTTNEDNDFTGNLTISSRFVISNIGSITAQMLSTGVIRNDLETAYTELARNVTTRLTQADRQNIFRIADEPGVHYARGRNYNERHLRRLTTNFANNTGSIDRIVDLAPCPGGVEAGSLCQIVFASFDVSVVRENAESVVEEHTREMDAAIQSGELQGALPLGSPLKIVGNMGPTSAPTVPPTSPPTATKSSGDGGLSTGAKVGIAFACILVAAGIGGGIYYYMKRRRDTRTTPLNEPYDKENENVEEQGEEEDLDPDSRAIWGARENSELHDSGTRSAWGNDYSGRESETRSAWGNDHSTRDSESHSLWEDSDDESEY